MTTPDLIRLRHMLEAVEAAEGFIAGRVRADLDLLWATATQALQRLRLALRAALEGA